MSGLINPAVNSPLLTAPKQIVNAYSAANWTPDANSLMPTITPFKLITSGALTANMLSQVLNVTGPGVVNFLGCSTSDATARKMRMQLIIDGVTVFDSLSNTISAGGVFGCVVGAYKIAGAPYGNIIWGDEIAFKSSLVFNVSSSLSETGSINTFVQYRTH